MLQSNDLLYEYFNSILLITQKPGHFSASPLGYTLNISTVSTVVDCKHFKVMDGYQTCNQKCGYVFNYLLVSRHKVKGLCHYQMDFKQRWY